MASTRTARDRCIAHCCACSRSISSEFESEMGGDLPGTGVTTRNGEKARWDYWHCGGKQSPYLHDGRTAEHLSMLRQDTRYALRMIAETIWATRPLRSSRWRWALACTLAIVSVIDAVLLKPLPYQQGDQLVMLHKRAEKAGIKCWLFRSRNQRLSPASGSLSELVEYHGMSFTAFFEERSHSRAHRRCIGRIFSRVRRETDPGQGLTPADDQAGSASRFNCSATNIGKSTRAAILTLR